MSLLSDLKIDPRHGPEIALLYTFQALRPRLESNWKAHQALLAIPSDGAQRSSGARVSLAVPKRALLRARRDGAMTGTSFLIATPIGLLSIWLNQLTMVLGIAASAGLDPSSPQRLAEFLVFSGMYPSVDEATSALSSIPSQGEKVGRRSLTAALVALVAQIPALLGVTARRARRMSVRQIAGLVVTGIGCVFPVVGVPVFAYGSAKETRLLGGRAVEFYDLVASDYRAKVVPAGLSGRLEASESVGARRTFAGVAVAIVALLVFVTGFWLARRHGVRVDVALGVLWVWALVSCANVWAALRSAGRPFR